MMKKILHLIVLVFFIGYGFNTVQAQYENTSKQKKEQKEEKKKVKKQQLPARWFVGGMIGAGFSSNSSYVEISPVIGYVPVRNLHVGARLTYIYNSRIIQSGVDPYQESRINMHHFGIAGLVRYIIFKGIFAQAEYEYLSYDDVYYDLNKNSNTYGQQFSKRIPISTLFLGGGFFQRFGNGFASFAILFPIAENYESFYNTAVVRISFGGFF